MVIQGFYNIPKIKRCTCLGRNISRPQPLVSHPGLMPETITLKAETPVVQCPGDGIDMLQVHALVPRTQSMNVVLGAWSKA